MRKFPPILLFALTFRAAASRGLAWGREGHEVIALMALQYMTGPALGDYLDRYQPRSGAAAQLLANSNWQNPTKAE